MTLLIDQPMFAMTLTQPSFLSISYDSGAANQLAVFGGAGGN
jgi:hypothetical protein